MTQFELMVAPNGARLNKADHPALPITAPELAETAYACAQAGASAIHVHVRDEHTRHSLSPGKYEDAIQLIGAKSAIPVQVSTEAAGLYDVDAQWHLLKETSAKDASVALSEIARDPDHFSEIYQDAAARSISLQHILYTAKDVSKLLGHFDRNEIPPQSRRAIFVLGKYNRDLQSSPKDLKPFLQEKGSDLLEWSVCAFGLQEHLCLLDALNLGGNARLGFENNRFAPDGSVFPDNQSSVLSFVEMAAKSGFHPKRVMQ